MSKRVNNKKGNYAKRRSCKENPCKVRCSSRHVPLRHQAPTARAPIAVLFMDAVNRAMRKAP